MFKEILWLFLKKSYTRLILVTICLTLPLSVYAQSNEPISPVSPHNNLGIVDINQGLEAAHHPGYKFFEANYQQGLYLGATWNRWEVNWAAVEQEPGVFNWVCSDIDCLAPGQGEGNYFDYPQLASADETRGLNALVILTEIPECYQAGNTVDPKKGCYVAEPGDPLIEGLNVDIFLLTNGNSTNNPYHPDINPDSPIIVANRWAWFVYQAMEQLGPLGVHHWQVMNEMNINLLWERNNAINNYVRMVEIVSKLITYRQAPDKVILGGLAYQYNVDTKLGLNEWGRNMFFTLDLALNSSDLIVNALAFHPYDRSKTSYDFFQEAITYFEDETLNELLQIPAWYTETGSNGCGDEVFSIPPGTRMQICPPSLEEPDQPRSSDIEQRDYIIQSMAYAFSSPDVDKYFQFHLHDFCPYGSVPDTDLRYRPGYGLYRNWPQYDHLAGKNNTCAVRPYDGSEKPATQGLAQASRWLRDFIGYSEPTTSSSAEFLIFPQNYNQRTYVAWVREAHTIVYLRFYPATGMSGGPILAVDPNGNKEVINRHGSGYYEVRLNSPTTPILGRGDGLPMIGGEPVILLEHILFDLGAKPGVFDPTGGIAALQFGLNLPAGIITQDIVSITIYDEADNIVWANGALFSNGEHRWEWDGRNGQSGEPVPNGLYHYEIRLPNQGNYTITGVVGVSQPGVLACFFNTTPPQPPDYYPPSPNQAFVDYRGSETYDEIDFYWPTTPPIPELEDNDNWIARYVGYLEVETAGMYQFRLGDTDDVARLFVNGALILMPDWITLTSDEPLDLYSPDVYLSEGLHTIVIEHAQIEDSASLQLLWRQATPHSLWWAVDTLWLPGNNLTDVCTVTTPVPPGVFRNGDFEDGFNYWTLIPDTPEPRRGWFLDSDNPHNGEHSAKGYMGGAVPLYLTSDVFLAVANSCQDISLFFKGYATPYSGYEHALFKVSLQWYDANGTLIRDDEILTVEFTDVPANWYAFTEQITTPANSAGGEIIFSLVYPGQSVTADYFWGAEAVIHIDDITITACP